jgi:hypothetical protein
MKIYEIYRIGRDLPLTVSLLCQMEIDGKACPLPNFIWDRRKDMTGAHFRVGVLAQVSLLKKENTVIALFVIRVQIHKTF